MDLSRSHEKIPTGVKSSSERGAAMYKSITATHDIRDISQLRSLEKLAQTAQHYGLHGKCDPIISYSTLSSSIPHHELLSHRERSLCQLYTGAFRQRREPRLPLSRSRRHCLKHIRKLDQRMSKVIQCLKSTRPQAGFDQDMRKFEERADAPTQDNDAREAPEAEPPQEYGRLDTHS
eukprot:9339993-Pyramimonas_sp.AAC.1